jgi:cell division protein ZapA
MQQKKLSIKIKIAEREYSLITDATMESKLRTAGKLINEKLRQYNRELGVQDRQDLLSMIALDAMVEVLDLKEEAHISFLKIQDKIKQIDEFASAGVA